MGGREAIGELLDLDPAVRAIVSSGYCDDAVLARHREHGFAAVLPKPYGTRDLQRILASLPPRATLLSRHR
jgi:CheY-like chemotaxis protein